MTYPLVSVVVTGYRRPDLLKRTIESFHTVNNWPSVETILADDGSPPDLQDEMRRLPFDRHLLPMVNRGLGANTNAGLAAARGEYILALQDDWLCKGPGDFIARAIEAMQRQPEVGFVRLTHREGPVFDRHMVESAPTLCVYRPPPRRSDAWIYTDTPHLKSRACMQQLGPYLEVRQMRRTEMDMRDRFNRQTRFRAGFLEGYDCFEHIGEEQSHNTLPPLARVSAFLDGLPVTRPAIRAYRRAKRWLRYRGSSDP